MSFLKIDYRRPLFVWLVMLLVACGSGPHNGLYPSSSGVMPGSQIKLHQPLPIKPGRTRVFLQRGVLVSENPDQYHPHCNFEVRALSDEPRLIVPDSFLITRLQQGVEEVVGLDPVRVAALGASAWYPLDAPLVSRYLHLYLASELQPDVMRLTCHGAFDFVSDAQWPSINEIREALGEMAVFQNHPQPGVIK